MSGIEIGQQEAGGRRGRRARRGGGAGESMPAIQQAPFRQPKMIYPPVKAVSDDELESIHQASLKVLAEIGIDFMHEEAKALLKSAGAEVEATGDRVRFDPAMVESYLGKAPETFTLHARNPDHNLQFGGDAMIFSTVASAPNSADRDGGRRRGNQTDFRNFIKLGQFFNIIHVFPGYPVEPVDIHARYRHLECLRDFAVMSDKVFHAYSLGKERNQDGLEITRIARGITDAQLDEEPSLFSIINSSSPLRLDTPMLQGIIEMSRRNQVVVLTPFTLAGAMAPVTIAGAVVQQNAEALAGLVFSQVVREGAPFVYGGFTSNVDMKSGAPAFGTPEYMRAAHLGGQLARRYRLPYRSSNTCAANTLDAQAAYESVFSLWGAIMGGSNLLMHGAGWMEGGLQASFEKLILDVDLLQMVAEYLTPLGTSEDDLALEAMRDVGPGGHFFGTQHTQDRYKEAFYQPLVSDWRNFESWQQAGEPTAYDRTNTLYKQALNLYEAPPIDPAIKEELDAFVAKRTEEGGAPTDF